MAVSSRVIADSWLFDVDGTIVDSITGRSLRPHTRELLGALRERGIHVLMWSSGGADYASRRMAEAGVADLVTATYAKLRRDQAGRWVLPGVLTNSPPSVLVDDLPDEVPRVGTVVGVPPYVGPHQYDHAFAALLQRLDSASRTGGFFRADD